MYVAMFLCVCLNVWTDRKICVSLTTFNYLSVTLSFFFIQSASEKHKINVPETINEFLDMSDDDGMWSFLKHLFSSFFYYGYHLYCMAEFFDHCMFNCMCIQTTQFGLMYQKFSERSVFLKLIKVLVISLNLFSDVCFL